MKGWEVQQVGAAVRRPFLGSRGSNCLAAPKQDVGGGPKPPLGLSDTLPNVGTGLGALVSLGCDPHPQLVATMSPSPGSQGSWLVL